MKFKNKIILIIIKIKFTSKSTAHCPLIRVNTPLQMSSRLTKFTEDPQGMLSGTGASLNAS